MVKSINLASPYIR